MSRSDRPSFRSTLAVPCSSSQPASGTQIAEARRRRPIRQSKRIVTLCATYPFYRDPQASCANRCFPYCGLTVPALKQAALLRSISPSHLARSRPSFPLLLAGGICARKSAQRAVGLNQKDAETGLERGPRSPGMYFGRFRSDEQRNLQNRGARCFCHAACHMLWSSGQ
jgi:hypothetical protein